MSLYVKVNVNFYTHRKTARLKAILGTDAYWLPPRLWAYAADNQPDGNFDGYSAAEIANLIGYTGDASSMLQALLQAGFMDENPLRIHDWHVFNSYHVTFADRAKKAADARWQKEKNQKKDREESTREDRTGQETSIASSMLQASAPTAAATPTTVQSSFSSIQDYLAAEETKALFAELQASPAYSGIDVKAEAAKMFEWCAANSKQPTKRRLINWLNRADKPLSRQSQKQQTPISERNYKKSW